MITTEKRVLGPGERIRILVVDDSVVIRRLVTHALEAEADFQVVGAASNGAIAMQRIPQFNPDILILDVEMPEMNGLELLRNIRGQYPQMRIIMFSTLTERGAAVTLEALTLGADDYVPKASNEGSLDRSMARLRGELVPKIRQFFQLIGNGRTLPGPANGMSRPEAPLSSSTARSAPAGPVAPPPQQQRPLNQAARAVVMGVSTGGPMALGEILPQLPAHFPLPVLIVQHMPPVFTQLLAERLNSCCKLRVREAAQGDLVEAGNIFIAPGDFHMKLESKGGRIHVALDQTPPQNSCRPAVDALFASAAEVYGGALLSTILTGMGQDGLRGAEILRARGASILAQDEQSSVVWGMPGAVVRAGLADRVLPLDRIVPKILELSHCR